MELEFDLSDLRDLKDRDYWNVIKSRVYRTKFAKIKSGMRLDIDNAQFMLKLSEPHKESVVVFCNLMDNQNCTALEYLENLVKIHKNKQIWIVTSHRLRKIAFSQLSRFPKQINFILLLDCDPKNRYKLERIYSKPSWIFYKQNLEIEMKESAKPKKRKSNFVDEEWAIMSALYRRCGDSFGF